MTMLSFDEYCENLSRVTAYVDPTLPTPESVEIKQAALSLSELPTRDLDEITTWIQGNPDSVPVLGLTVGLSREKLKNTLRQHLGSSSWKLLARTKPRQVAEVLDREYALLTSLEAQCDRTYGFGDLLVARAGTRVTATSATTAGRMVEDRIEAVANNLNLSYDTRGRFTGRSKRTAPCDLAVPGAGSEALIVVAAKAFDSTGSKLTDAVREVEEMAEVRTPSQFVYAVIDGVGWLSRTSDLRRLHALWLVRAIDGLYTLRTLDAFEVELERAARIHGLLE
ncbi:MULTISPECIES: hypothetical protein [Dietzia]|uniref:hypothetical protein n=1 Tax=Dietzia TaxID=37914 RepID=UPI000BDF3FD8|nr:hypothetical protein [Dietzia sp. WMMA184]